jgi:hypothetical protein
MHLCSPLANKFFFPSINLSFLSTPTNSRDQLSATSRNALLLTNTRRRSLSSFVRVSNLLASTRFTCRTRAIVVPFCFRGNVISFSFASVSNANQTEIRDQSRPITHFAPKQLIKSKCADKFNLIAFSRQFFFFRLFRLSEVGVQIQNVCKFILARLFAPEPRPMVRLRFFKSLGFLLLCTFRPLSGLARLSDRKCFACSALGLCFDAQTARSSLLVHSLH